VTNHLKTALLNNTAHPVSSITMNDYLLFRSWFRQDARKLGQDAVYAHSFTYIRQACRAFGMGLKYHTDKALCAIGAHRGHYVVVRPMGVLDSQFISFLDTLRTLSGKPVFIKKLFPAQSECLRQQALFCTARIFKHGLPHPGDYPWDEYAYADDDTYPELIYHADVVLNYGLRMDKWGEVFATKREEITTDELRFFKRKMRDVRQAINVYQKENPDISVVRYHPKMRLAIEQFLKDYFEDRHAHLQAHLDLVTPPDGASEENYFNMVTLDGKEIIAYHIAERSGKNAASCCVGVSTQKISGLGAFIYYYLFQYLAPYGIKRFNAGGSERRSLHRFKLKPAPIEERHMDMLVYGV
jgi:hypothetical protein